MFDETLFGLDEFPATRSSKGNVLGKQVKIPLSVHTKGRQSFFFEGDFNYNKYGKEFWEEQNAILNNLKPNKAEEVFEKLEIVENESVVTYKRIYVDSAVECSIEDVIKILSNVRAYKEVIYRITNGNAISKDWFVMLGTLGKPDICYYGGDGTKAEEKIAVCTDELGAIYLSGTSFAAPWITRKLAYLICVMGLSREVAKALIIDSAAKWGPSGNVSDTMGYGVVPKRIEDILNTSDDEIKFIITGTTEDYETYNYTLPVPVVNGKHPYYAKAVLCYFPYCDRNQGVDYTGTEMDIHFGRVITEKKNGTIKTKIKAIDDNKQTEEGQVMYEEDARNVFRKWDNVKRICEKVKDRRVPKKSYDAGMWGIGVITKERVTSKNRRPLQFGLVITLKEMYGKNRIEGFAKMCEAKGWLVNRLDVQNQLDIYARAEEEIKFD